MEEQQQIAKGRQSVRVRGEVMGCAESSSSEQAGRKAVHSSKAPAFSLHMSPPSYVALEESHLPGLN